MISLPPLRPAAGRDRTALLVVPPFASIDRPSLALHLLQACANQLGFSVSIFYANLYLAKMLGVSLHEAISHAPTHWLLGERFFAHAAYGKTPLTKETLDLLKRRKEDEFEIDSTALLEWAPQADRIGQELAQIIADCEYPIVGLTTTFEQTAASIALIERVKSLKPATLAIMGGANCEGTMAAGIASLSSMVDYIFSGESEAEFPRFLQAWRAGKLPQARIINGEPCWNLGDLPLPDYGEFYDQLRLFVPHLAESCDVWLPYESSRGCWWGAKHHCTFCGLNGQTLAHRQKPGKGALIELERLLANHPSRKVNMVDNIMPYDYFQTFLPNIRDALGEVDIFYEEKSNLSLSQVVLLKEAGVNVIQPGIESLSTPVLKLMDKGVSARKNLELLRFARSVEMTLNWNYLIAFPSDRAEDYWAVVDMIPLLVHLCPPGGLYELSIERFSPYFERPQSYGITDVRPLEAYFDVLPNDADVATIAYHFRAEYNSGSRADAKLQSSLREAIDGWRGLWSQNETAPPTLSIHPLNDENYLLLDSRFDLSEPVIEFVDDRQMRLLLTGQHDGDVHILEWAKKRRYVIALDGQWVPLATSDPQTFAAALGGVRFSSVHSTAPTTPAA